MLEQRRQQMALDMIDADQRESAALRQSFGAHQSNQQRSDQAGPARHRDTVEVLQAASRGFQRAPITGMIVTT